MRTFFKKMNAAFDYRNGLIGDCLHLVLLIGLVVTCYKGSFYFLMLVDDQEGLKNIMLVDDQEGLKNILLTINDNTQFRDVFAYIMLFGFLVLFAIIKILEVLRYWVEGVYRKPEPLKIKMIPARRKECQQCRISSPLPGR